MEIKPFYIYTLLSFIVVLLLILTIQVRSIIKLHKKKDKRANTKLNILYLCKLESKTYEQLVTEYKQLYPDGTKNAVEMSKIIYEMLAEGTLIHLENKTFKSASKQL